MTKVPNAGLADIAGKVVAITGHRPGKIFSYAEAEYELVRFYVSLFERHRPKEILSGMALGADMAAAEAATVLSIPWHAQIPCDNQECRWPAASQQRYRQLLTYAASQVIVTPGPYNSYCMQARNKHMVDNCQIVLAIWDGSAGGTGNCVVYARQQKRPVINVIDDWRKFRNAI